MKSTLIEAMPPHRWRHSVWFWLAVALLLIVFVLIARTAAAQTQRATSIIESVLALQPDKRRGGSLYKEECAACHGRRAYGDTKPVTPSLAGQQSLYLTKQLVDFAEGDRSGVEMHRITALKRLSTPQAISDIAGYLSGLEPNPKPELGEGKDLGTGKRFYEGLCAFCHGSQGEGNEAHATPALRRQHYSYLLMQTRQLSLGHRYSVPNEVLEIVEALPFDVMVSIADYAARLPQPSSVESEPVTEPR